MAVASAGDDLKWPERYTTSGVIYLPYASVAEPFTAVVDMPQKRSMLNTYDGMSYLLCYAYLFNILV